MQILVSVVSNNICKDASHYGGSSEKMKFWFQQEILDAISLFCNIFQCRCYQNKWLDILFIQVIELYWISYYAEYIR